MTETLDILRELGLGLAETPAALPGLAGWLYGQVGGNKANAATRFSDSYVRGLRELVGAKPHEELTFPERVANVAGSVAFPLPGVAAAVKAADTGTKLGKLGHGAARAAEMTVIPGSSPYTVGNVAANVGVGTALNEGIRKLLGVQEPSDDPAFRVPVSDPAFTPLPEPDPAFTPLPLDAEPDPAFVIPPDLAFTPPEGADDWTLAEYATLGATAVLTAWGIARHVPGIRTVTPDVKSTNVPSGTPMQGQENALTSFATYGEKKIQNIYDPEFSFTSLMDKADVDPAQVKEWTNRVATGTRMGGVTQARHTLNTGEMPISDVRIPSFVDEKRLYDTLPVQDKDLLNKALHYQSLRDFGKLPPDLEANSVFDTIANARSNPVLRDMMEKYEQATKGTWRWLRDVGMIGDEAFERLRNHKYVPSIEYDPKMNKFFVMIGKNVEQWMVPDEMSRILKSADFLKAKQGGIEDLLNPYDALEHYVSSVVQLGLKNDIKRRAVDIVNDPTAFNFAFRDFMSRKPVAKGDAAVALERDPSHVFFRDKGQPVAYKVADPLYASALNFQPYAISSGMMNGTRRVWQEMTTGRAAPWRMPKTLIWDALYSAAARPPGTRAGMVDALLQDVSGGHLSLPGDPTFMISSIAGVGRDVASRMFLDMTRAFDTALRGHSGLWASLPDGIRDPLARLANKAFVEAMDMYRESPRGIGEKYGVLIGGGKFDPQEMMQKISAGLTPRGPLGWMWHTYQSLFEAVHNGPKVAFIAQNMKALERKYGGNIPQAEMRKMATQAKQLAGDFSRSGTGRGYRAAAGSIPYLNVTVQAIGRLAEISTRDKAFAPLMFGLFNAAIAPAIIGDYLMSSASPEHRKWLWERLSPNEKGQNIFLPIPTDSGFLPIGPNGENVIAIPLFPESWLVTNPIRAMLGSMLGLHNGASFIGGMGDTIASFADAFSVPIPPVLQALSAAMGQRLEMGFDASDPAMAGPLHVREIKPGLMDPVRGGKYPTSTFAANTEEFIASLIGTWGGIAQNVTASFNAGGDVTEELKYEIGRRLPVVSSALGFHVDTVNTPVARERRRLIESASTISKQWQLQLTGGQPSGGGMGPNVEGSGRTPLVPDGDPLIAEIANLNAAVTRNPAYASLNHQRNKIKLDIARVDAGRSAFDLSPKDRNARMNELKREYLATEESLYYIIKDAELSTGLNLKDVEARMMKALR